MVECHFTTGPYSMLVKVYVQDTSHLMELLNDRIQHIPGVTATETLISLEQSLNRELQLPLVPGRKHLLFCPRYLRGACAPAARYPARYSQRPGGAGL